MSVFDDVDYAHELDDNQYRALMAQVERDREWQDVAVAQGASLEPGSDQARARILAKAGLDAEAQSRLYTRGLDFNDAASRDADDVSDDRARDMRELAQARDEQDALARECAEELRDAEVRREQNEHAAKHRIIEAESEVLGAICESTTSHADDEVAAAAEADFMRAAHDTGVSAAALKKRVADTVSYVSEVASDELMRENEADKKDDGFEMGM